MGELHSARGKLEMATTHTRMSIREMVKSARNRDKQLRWSDILEVRERLAYTEQNTNSINFYETKFEILSQEASFNLRLRSLLGAFFVSKVISDMDRKNLFATMEKVLQVSDAFLADLELCWLSDIFLTGIFDIIKKHEGSFDAYVKYCSTQKSTSLHLKKLRAEKNDFIVLLERWHSSPANYSKLDLESFLDLPKIRMTTLVTTCVRAASLLDKSDAEYKSCQVAAKTMKKLADKCDHAVAVHGKRVKILRIFDQLVFSNSITPIPIASSSRELIKIDELTLLDLSDLHKRSQRHLILFNDLLLITMKTKKEERYEIIDYCYLVNLELKNTEDLLSLMKGSVLKDSHNKLLMIKLKQNHEHKPVIHLFCCSLEMSCGSWQKYLEDLILRNAPKLAVPELRGKEEPPLPNRSSQEQKLVEELVRKQKARKSDWPESQAALDSIVEDKLGNVIDNRPLQIPRPVTRSVSPAHSDTLEVPAKPSKQVAPRQKTGVEATIQFDRMLEYPPGITVFPLISAGRWMVQSGEMVQRWHYEERKYSETKIPFTLSLFNDVVFLTTKNKGDTRRVLTYGPRSLVEATRVKKSPHLPSKLASDRNGKFMMTIHFLENHRHQEETLVVSVDGEGERDRWLAAMPCPAPDNGGDVVYDPWDRPLVMAVAAHLPNAGGQMQLAVSDKMHVNRRRADGWYEGERVSDGQAGSFPASVTVELESSHKYAREIRQKALTANHTN